MIEISITELREKYETMPVREVARYFDLPNLNRLYKLLEEAGIPKKKVQRAHRTFKLVK
jgi:hypothetical protein